MIRNLTGYLVGYPAGYLVGYLIGHVMRDLIRYLAGYLVELCKAPLVHAWGCRTGSVVLQYKTPRK